MTEKSKTMARHASELTDDEFLAGIRELEGAAYQADFDRQNAADCEKYKSQLPEPFDKNDLATSSERTAAIMARR